MDMLVTNSNNKPILYQNFAGLKKSWVEFKVAGTRSNRNGVGTRIKVTTGGTSQIREVNCGNGYQSQSSFRVHFGLGAKTKIDVVEIKWPSGLVETYRHVAANRIISLTEASLR
jgi:hypothetical protein